MFPTCVLHSHTSHTDESFLSYSSLSNFNYLLFSAKVSRFSYISPQTKKIASSGKN